MCYNVTVVVRLAQAHSRYNIRKLVNITGLQNLGKYMIRHDNGVKIVSTENLLILFAVEVYLRWRVII